MKIPGSQFVEPHRQWPTEVPDAPDELVHLIRDALADFGPSDPHGHGDGAEVIAALAYQWVSGPTTRAKPPPPTDPTKAFQ